MTKMKNHHLLCHSINYKSLRFLILASDSLNNIIDLLEINVLNISATLKPQVMFLTKPLQIPKL